MTLATEAARIKGGCWRSPPTHPSLTTIAPPLYPQAHRLFNNSLLQLFSILRLGVVGSMGAQISRGCKSGHCPKKLKHYFPASLKNLVQNQLATVFHLDKRRKASYSASAPGQRCRCLSRAVYFFSFSGTSIAVP